MLTSAITAWIRRNFAQDYGEGEGRIQANNRGDLLVAQALPPKSDLARLGNTWVTAIDTADAFTYVAGWPTTRAELVLFNNEPAGGKSYLLDAAFLYGVTSQAAAQPATLAGQLVAPGVAAPTDNTSLLITSRSGKPNYGGKARKAIANTAFAVANRWEVLGSVQSPMTTNLGAALYVELLGGFIVPPQGAFCLAGIAGTAAGTAICGAVWHEVQTSLS